MQEILFYSPIYDYTAAKFITDLEAAKNQDVTIRLNTNGGSPEAAFGMIAKMAERTKKTYIKVDGKAHSMGAFTLAYSSNTEALDVSEFLIHRAAYPSYVEKDPEYMTPEMWSSLNRVNGKLRAALEAKINIPKFIEVTGKTMDDVFSTSQRLDVLLTASQALEIGLIDKIVSLTPERNAEITRHYAIAAQSGIMLEPAPKTGKVQPQKNKAMTAAEFKAQHPDAYNEIIETERDRIQAMIQFIDVDSDGVKAAIASGKPMTQAQAMEWTRKSLTAEFMKGAEAGSPDGVIPAKKAETPKNETEAQKIERELDEAIAKISKK